MIYCCSQKQCEMMMSELECEHYHADLTDRSSQISVWLFTSEWIVTTMTLEIRVDYLKIMFVLHVRMSYEMIDFAQKSRQTEWEEETVNSMMLMKNDETQWWLKYELILNESVMIKFVLLNRCWWKMMSLYFDKKQTICKDENMMLCNQCRKKIIEWQKS